MRFDAGHAYPLNRRWIFAAEQHRHCPPPHDLLDSGPTGLRVRTVADTAAPDSNPSKTSHYGDSPAWADESSTSGPDGKPTAWTRYLTGLDGNLVLTQNQTGAFTYQLANLHGDIAATIASTNTTSPDTFLSADEFGNPAGPAASATTGGRYGWLGSNQRSNETAGNLTLMGVRLYAPTLGRFLQTDPVPGGSDNAYDYVGQDPINAYDLDGRWCHSFSCAKHAVRKHWRGIAQGALIGACVLASAGACLGASILVAAAVNTRHSSSGWTFNKTGFAVDAGLAVGGAFARQTRVRELDRYGLPTNRRARVGGWPTCCEAGAKFWKHRLERAHQSQPCWCRGGRRHVVAPPAGAI